MSASPSALRSPDAYRRMCVLSLWALCAIIVTGAAVRLTGSGLGCTEWPTCAEGRVVAPLEYHAMIEFVNRLITGVVSVAVIVAVAGSVVRIPRRRDLTRWSLGLVVGVLAQIVIGAFVVRSDLEYSVVALHFLVSMVLVAAAVVLVHRSSTPDDEEPRRWAGWARALVGACVAVLVSGPLVASAGPHPGAIEGAARDGGDLVLRRLPIDLVWVARIHSATVWVFVLGVVVAAWRNRGRDPLLGRRLVDLLVVTVAQGALGYVQYFSGVPAFLVGIHVLGATLMWVMTLRVAQISAGATAESPEISPAVVPA
ncbi:MAG: COX15/CtaA family protein [Microthrixaceae bacterium]|nr:COX15/CtaA family protein [Microthrixaceae bacterium]